MDGPKVWDFAVHAVPRTILGLLAEHGLKASDLDLVILHQSNLRMIHAIMEALGLPLERAVTTVEHYGNTAAASIPLTLQKALDVGRLRSGSSGDDVRIRRRTVLGCGSRRLVTAI
jgi:3-oxoacyl-[acyl-carrier-protein] synthase-3